MNNVWIFNSMLANDSIIYLPCESLESYIEIWEYDGIGDYDLYLAGHAAETGFLAAVHISGDSILLSDDFMETLSVGTLAEIEFEKIYFHGITANAQLKFNIIDNQLVLWNPDNNIELNYYTLE